MKFSNNILWCYFALIFELSTILKSNKKYPHKKDMLIFLHKITTNNLSNKLNFRNYQWTQTYLDINLECLFVKYKIILIRVWRIKHK